MSETLSKTIADMMSDDYRKRFQAEMDQNTIRLNKLLFLIDKVLDGKADFTPDCPIELLIAQAHLMESLNAIYLLRLTYEDKAKDE